MWELHLVGKVISALMGVVVAAVITTRQARSAMSQLAVLAVVLYVGTAAVALLDVTRRYDPGFPHIQVNSYTGWLVSHTDRYWFVLTESGHVVAVPDDPTTVIIRP